MVFYVNRLDGNGNSVPIVVGLKNTNTNDTKNENHPSICKNKYIIFLKSTFILV